MMLDPTNWFGMVAPEVAVYVLSMLPITELRAAIPIGIEVYKLPVWQTWIIAVLGNMTPTICLLLIMPYIHDWVIKQPYVGKVLRKKMEHAEKKFRTSHSKWGEIALVIFVGIPLPLTGAWTGSLAAFIFNMPFKKSFPLILSGVCIAATIVTIMTVFAGGALRFLL